MKVLVKYEDDEHIVTFDLQKLAELIELTPEQIQAAKNAALRQVAIS